MPRKSSKRIIRYLVHFCADGTCYPESSIECSTLKEAKQEAKQERRSANNDGFNFRIYRPLKDINTKEFWYSQTLVYANNGLSEIQITRLDESDWYTEESQNAF